MSDAGLEEESLISQDDIDKLLDGTSIEEAEARIDAGGEGEDALDDMGELSQDDIDNLLNGGPLGSEPEASVPEDLDPVSIEPEDLDFQGGEDDMGELSQDDIDSLLNGGPSEETPVDIAADPPEDDMGELSQDDIDSLLNGPGLGADEPEDEPEEPVSALDEIAADGDDMELISQDDIDRLMNSPDVEEELPDPGSAQGADDGLDLVDQDDIQSLLDDVDGMPDEVNGEAGMDAADEAVGDDFLIDASDAVDVADCLITQEALDELIRNAPAPADQEQATNPEPVILNGEADALVDMADDDPGEPDVGDDEDPDGMKALDELLGEDAEDPVPDPEGPDTDEVTQEDIDALLQESDDDEDVLEDDDDILISQDDIDTLLMAADQEDEDVLGDLMGDDADPSGDEDFDHEDILDSDIPEDGDDGDQVVLEGLDASGQETRTEKKTASGNKWYRSKLLVVTAGVMLILGITVPAAYFLFFSKKTPAAPEGRMSVPVAENTAVPDVTVDTVKVEVPREPTVRTPGNMVLADFIILASDKSKDMAYVTLDISIDYSDQRAYHEINSNISFYRDLIYESIQQNLVWEKRNEVTEAELVFGVEASLKKVLPPHYIENISFKSFKAS